MNNSIDRSSINFIENFVSIVFCTVNNFILKETVNKEIYRIIEKFLNKV